MNQTFQKMKSTKITSLIFFIILVYNQSFSQHPNRIYMTNEYMSKIPANEMTSINTETNKVDPSIITRQPIAVVFNVLYSQEPMSEEDIQLQVEALNRDFGTHKQAIDHAAMQIEKFNLVQATMNINFCASNRVDGDFINPIMQRKSSKEEWPIGNLIKQETTGGITTRNQEKVINIWIAELENNVAGFAQMPGGDLAFDGIVIDPDYLVDMDGTNYPFHQGKTLTHLMGNYFGLYPLWGEQPCQDDMVTDTPIHNAPSFGCPEYRTVSPCNPQTVIGSMHMNFMDGSNDECTGMFTIGQRDRVYQFLGENGLRHSLVSTAVECLSNEKHKIFSNIQQTLEITPNPASEFIQISLTKESCQDCILSIYTSNGTQIFKSTLNKTEKTLKVKDWPSGLYQANVHEKGETILSEKFIVVD